MLPNISLQKICYFVSIVESGSILNASKRHRISSSVISDAIRDIEQEIGGKLLERKKNGMVPNEFGLHVYKKFKAAVNQLEFLLDFKNDFQEITGRLTIAVSPTISDHFLFPLIRDLKIVYPKIEPALLELNSVRDLENNPGIDLSLFNTSNYAVPDKFRKILLQSFPRKLWVSEKNPLSEKEEVTLKDIEKEKYIQCTSDNQESFIQRRFTPQTVFRTISIEATKSLVGANFGVTIMPDNDYTIYSSYGDHIVRRVIQDEDFFMELGVLVSKEKPLSTPALKVLEFMQSRKWD